MDGKPPGFVQRLGNTPDSNPIRYPPGECQKWYYRYEVVYTKFDHTSLMEVRSD